MSNKRGWGFRVLALCLGLCLLPAIELLARAAERSAGRPANEFFYTRVFEPRGGLWVTRESRRGFFMAQEFPAAKSPGTTRVFIVGGSTAMGFPYQGDYGMAELLRTALPIVRGGRSYEVINAAAFGYNSSRAAAVALEALDYQPDALIMMAGHNEFLEQRVGGGWDYAAGRLLIGLERWLRGRQDTVRWEAHDVTAAERARAERRMESALARVAAKARRRGIPLILLTCPSETRDFRPHGPSAVPAAEQKTIDGLLRAGDPALAAALGRQDRLHPDDAWISFMRGKLGERAENSDNGAEAWFVRARDRDPQPVRATSAINDLVRRVARERGAVLVDAEREFTARTRGGAAEFIFLDHCHPSYAGQRVLAQAALAGLAMAGVVPAPTADQVSTVFTKWDQEYSVLPAAPRAEFFYRVAVEAGMNMHRPCRGYELAGLALVADPGHKKAIELRERLRPANDAGCLTGD